MHLGITTVYYDYGYYVYYYYVVLDFTILRLLNCCCCCCCRCWAAAAPSTTITTTTTTTTRSLGVGATEALTELGLFAHAEVAMLNGRVVGTGDYSTSLPTLP
jgi:hypothetical protein